MIYCQESYTWLHSLKKIVPQKKEKSCRHTTIIFSKLDKFSNRTFSISDTRGLLCCSADRNGAQEPEVVSSVGGRGCLQIYGNNFIVVGRVKVCTWSIESVKTRHFSRSDLDRFRQPLV